MKTFNKRGDGGETSLLYGVRVAKNDPHCEAYGTVDEANSALGLARALSQNKRIQGILFQVQQDLFTLSAELATPKERYAEFVQKHRGVSQEMVHQLEDIITELENEIEMPHSFIIPGSTVSPAALDLARTIIRRAERRVVDLKEMEQVANEELPKYLNRLADLIFTLARYEEKQL
jgi:cob(I)alamin adenosyltransferase